MPCLDPDILQPGKHLTFQFDAEILSGIVDEVMPDKSCFWIWSDDGMGRRLIVAQSAAELPPRS